MHPTMRHVGIHLFVLLAVLSCACPAAAAIPSTMSYQGLLTDAAGIPVADGSYALTFRIYPTLGGGGPLWTETQGSVPVSKGIFSLTLGSVTPLALAFDQPYWLGVSIGADPELAPRTALASSPYALGVRMPLPANSVGAQVLIDEPGIAQSIYAGTYDVIGNANLNPASLLADLNVDITTPGPGYVMVEANAYITFSSVTAYEYVEYQISETTGLAAPVYRVPEWGYFQFCGFGAAPNTSYFDFPLATHRVFAKPSAGTYRFSLCTGRLGSYTPQATVTFLVLTATYFPTSYGTVSTAPIVPSGSLPLPALLLQGAAGVGVQGAAQPPTGREP